MSYGSVGVIASRPDQNGAPSIPATICAGNRTTSVIQNRTASPRRPASTNEVIVAEGSVGTSRVPGMMNGASYATSAAIGTPDHAARSASAAPDECPYTNAPAEGPPAAEMTAARSATSRSGE